MTEVTNPIQACNDIFLKPNAVFKALAEKDNWSWIPFFIVIITATVPSYLYFGVVDFDWYQNTSLATQMPDASPAEIENIKAMSSQSLVQTMTLIAGSIFMLIIVAIMSLYYTLVTRSDEKSIHSYLDWFGAQWWMLLPIVISSIISCVLILLTDAGAQVSEAILAPLSLGYIFGVEPSSQWFRVMIGLRLETIWSIYLGAVCLSQWTNFTMRKSVIVATIPTVLLLVVSLAFTL